MPTAFVAVLFLLEKVESIAMGSLFQTLTNSMSSHHHKGKKRKLPGASPGTYVYTGGHRSDSATIERVVFDRRSLERIIVTDPEKAIASRPAGSQLLVIVTGLHDETQVAGLCHKAGISHLLIEDILHVDGRPKIESHGEFLFVSIDAIEVGDSSEPGTQRLSIVATADSVICFTESHVRSLDPVLARLEQEGGRLRTRGGDYLTWAIIDSVIDHYFESIDGMREKVDQMETLIAEDFEEFDVRDLYQLKRKIDRLRRKARPAREIVTVLQRADSPVITEDTVPYLRDLYDHTVQVIDDLESLRDSVIGLRDFYSATASNRMNEVMKVLTGIATIFLPLTFLAGIYGMNFEWMPELKWQWAYPVLWGVFLFATGWMLWFFRKKKWL